MQPCGHLAHDGKLVRTRMARPLVVALVIELDDETVGTGWTEQHLVSSLLAECVATGWKLRVKAQSELMQRWSDGSGGDNQDRNGENFGGRLQSKTLKPAPAKKSIVRAKASAGRSEGLKPVRKPLTCCRPSVAAAQRHRHTSRPPLAFLARGWDGFRCSSACLAPSLSGLVGSPPRLASSTRALARSPASSVTSRGREDDANPFQQRTRPRRRSDLARSLALVFAECSLSLHTHHGDRENM